MGGGGVNGAQKALPAPSSSRVPGRQGDNRCPTIQPYCQGWGPVDNSLSQSETLNSRTLNSGYRSEWQCRRRFLRQPHSGRDGQRAGRVVGLPREGGEGGFSPVVDPNLRSVGQGGLEKRKERGGFPTLSPKATDIVSSLCPTAANWCGLGGPEGGGGAVGGAGGPQRRALS